MTDKNKARPNNSGTPRIDGVLASPVAFVPLMDEIPVPIIILDKERRVVALNQSAEVLTGFAIKDIKGLPCRHVLRSDVCVKDCPLKRAPQETLTVCREGDIINADRVRIPIRVSAAKLMDINGDTAGYIETVEDLRLLKSMEPKQDGAYNFAGIIGHSPQMEKLFNLLPSIAQTDSSVLLTGETGTGKDLLAEAIHQASGRAKGPFVKVNCGALPETLLEGELFGHVKGAFTGAVENRSGRFKLAHNGTLFLTEIGDLPLSLQVKLLSFLDDKTVYPLGGTKPIKVDVRVIAATHRDLRAMVQQGKFRQDLLFRLNVVRMHLPPLQERQADLALLMEHFLDSFNSAFHKSISGFDEESWDIMHSYAYPGNVRELRNIVEYAVNVCHEDIITARHLPVYILRPNPKEESPITALPDEVPAPFPPEQEASRTPQVHHGPAVAKSSNWKETERQLILDALVRSGGRKGKAAELLGWGRSTLWRKIKRHGLDEGDTQ